MSILPTYWKTGGNPSVNAYQIIALNTKIIPKIDEYKAHFSHLVLLSFCSDERSLLTRFSDFCVMNDIDSKDFLFLV